VRKLIKANQHIPNSIKKSRDPKEWAVEFYNKNSRKDIQAMEEWDYIDLLQLWFSNALKSKE
jgi:hypothetical protein